MIFEWSYRFILWCWLPRGVKLRPVSRAVVVLTMGRASWPVLLDRRVVVVLTGRQLRREGKILKLQSEKARAA